MEEEWRDIKGYENMYQISNIGQVKSLEHYVQQKKQMGSNYFKNTEIQFNENTYK